ncbi:hypothetical protein [Rhizobium chutanense]|uniref:hypothetical protein n=1 Tax=Rhizobium chutanense TaxID=2035448 RepID=UPI0013E0A719|nr:hypothetical protein [Rhizobium chutanense]
MSSLYPHAEATTGRFEKLLTEAEQGVALPEHGGSAEKVVALKDGDRGFDAPPL